MNFGMRRVVASVKAAAVMSQMYTGQQITIKELSGKCGLSRILLEITNVRVERLRDISQADAVAEGAPQSHPSIDAVSQQHGFPDFSRSWYGQTWQPIYGAESWQANPWVWVIEFKRIEGNV